MDSKVHPLVVILVIVGAIVAIASWMWGTDEAKSIGGPAQLTVGPNGHLYVQVQNSLLEHDADGNFVQEHDLRGIGVEMLLGGVSFFSNGDLLVRRGPGTRSFIDNLRAYRRETNKDSLVPNAPDAGLYRCSLTTKECSVFGSEPFDFKAAYGVYIDRETDEVYISDTTRHLLRKYAADGSALAGPVAGFLFPNGMVIVDGRLMLADTNHHRVVALDPATETFAEELDSIDVVPGAAQRAGQTWPNDVARVGDDWWVNNLQSGMDYGGIYVFDENWRFKRRVPLPQDADPIDLEPVGDQVFVSDWFNDAVWRVDPVTFSVTSLESSGFAAFIADLVERRRHFEMIAWLGIALFALILLALLISGLVMRSPDEPAAEKRKRNAIKTEFPEEMVWLEPDPGKVRRFRLFAKLAVLMLGVLVLGLAFLLIFGKRPHPNYSLAWLVAGVVSAYLVIGWASYVNLHTAIGLSGRNITLRNHRGREHTFPLTDVIYDGSTIVAGDMAVFMGQPAAPLYEQQMVMEHLYPRLALARSVSIWKMQGRLIRMRHPQGLLMLLIFVGLIVTLFWLLARQL